MNGLLLASRPNSKDIQFDPKKVLDLKEDGDETQYDFFQQLIENLLADLPGEEDKDFLIAKLLDLPSDIESKEQVIAPFSNEKLFNTHQIDKVSIETLLEIAAVLKTSPELTIPPDFPTDSQALKTSLLDLQVQTAFREANTIQDLLKIAAKNGIEVKNFEFFKEETALDPLAKAMVRKVNSEEIFKLMKQQITSSQQQLKNLQQPAPQAVKTHDTMLKDILSKAPVKEASQTQKTVSLDETPEPENLKRKTNISRQTKTASLSEHSTEDHPQSKSTITAQPLKKASLNTESQQHLDTHRNIQPEPADSENNTAPVKQKHAKSTKAPIEHIKSSITETEQILPPKNQNITNTSAAHHLKNTKATLTSSTSTHTTTLQQAISGQRITHPENSKQNKTEVSSRSKEIPLSAPAAAPESKHSPLHHIAVTTTQKKILTENAGENKHTHFIETKSDKEIKSETVISEPGESDPTVEKGTVSHETKQPQLHTIKHDQREIKRTFNNFAQEFREKVESYKPPLMKIKMQLNPGNLGDVDVTLINRGNNLHVNINASPNTIAIFSQNQAEFKNALVNMGFTGLQMQFGENREQQRGQQQRENGKSSRPFEEEPQEQEGFEMIVPRYV